MDFRITGKIRERESDLGVPGLMVRAYDKDLLYDDLLGTAITDEAGRFTMSYVERDFQELFERRPDIYLSVFLPPGRHLVDTENATRWDASSDEHFDLSVPRELLGDHSPSRPRDEVVGGMPVRPVRVRMRKRGEFDLPTLPGFTVGGPPGAPSLPRQLQWVALPLGGTVLSFDVLPGEAVKVAEQVNPMPAQRPVVLNDTSQCGQQFLGDTSQADFTPADAKYYDAAVYPEALAELEETIEYGPLRIARVRIRPVQYVSSHKCFLFFPNLRYRIRFDEAKARQRAAIPSREKASLGVYHGELIDLLLDQERVISARDLLLPDRRHLEEFPHLIITDNYEWPESVERGDGTTRAPEINERGAPLSGDLLAEFDRLAQWKTARGVRSRVVSISDIVNGTFGDHTQGGFARDLQEVIRNFIKHAFQNWDTLYVVLGGDVNVVPIRRLAGSWTGVCGCQARAQNPPTKGGCYFLTGRNAAKLRPKFTPAASDPLSTARGGLRLPYNQAASSSQPGWYFTVENDLLNQNEDFTRLPPEEATPYVIVEGPAQSIDDSYYWVREVNSIPSDLYYASLIGPAYSTPGIHDFDGNGNGLYGQYFWLDSEREETLDGVDFASDVWVGRLPVETGDQAKAAVDKILTYERLETPDAPASVDLAYLKKIIYVGESGFHKAQRRQPDTSQPPAAGMFTHEAGTTVTKIHTEIDLNFVDGTLSFRLLAWYALPTVIGYDPSASAENLGWYFCSDETYDVPSATPTRFIKVRGPEEDIYPYMFFWDIVGEMNYQILDKEQLRAKMNRWFSSFDDVQRHYDDHFDLAPPPPLVPLKISTIRAAIDEGVHFLSLSGHGTADGCCGLDAVQGFANAPHYFIAFADSCSTASTDDDEDSLGETASYDPAGGAVAYVGYTRLSFAPFGAGYEEFFWAKLAGTKRLGPAAGLRWGAGERWLWMTYALMLFGDPEMPVFTQTPRLYDVSYPAAAKWGSPVYVSVRKLGQPLVGHRVTIMGGWTDSSHDPTVLFTKTTNRFGQASFRLPSAGSPAAELSITVSHVNFKPFWATIPIQS